MELCQASGRIAAALDRKTLYEYVASPDGFKRQWAYYPPETVLAP